MNLWQVFKFLVAAFLVLVLQLAVLKELNTELSFNLPLVALIAISSFSNLQWSLYTAVFFIASTSLLTYNNSLYWPYLIVAFIANQYNPRNLEDKFLIAAFYSLLFTPIFELIYNPFRERLVEQCITSTLINLGTLIPLYFILKFFLAERKKNLYL